MKIFVDANILVSVLNLEYPVYPFSSRILGLVERPDWEVFTSPICLAIAFYFAEKRYGASSARKRMRTLATKLGITTTSQETVHSVFRTPAILDLEDGFEYFSAIEAGCTCIVTEDKDDFHFSTIEVLTAEEFVIKYVLSKRF
jgi:predicted nucleic acid-binding protein